MSAPYTVAEYAKLTKLHPVTVRQMCRVELLKANRPTKRPQGHWLIWEEPNPAKN